MKQFKILVMAASLRKDSHNKQLAAFIAKRLEIQGVVVDHLQFNDFTMPLYDFDVQQQGFPPGADALRAKILEADALVFSVPEYNYSIPGTFKNAIDWLSRYRPTVALSKKPILLTGVSNGMIGANRGLWQTRIPLEACLAYVYPNMFGLSWGAEAFDEQGDLKDEHLFKEVDTLLKDFTDWAKILSSK